MEQQKGVTHRRRFGRPIWTSEIASNTGYDKPDFSSPSWLLFGASARSTVAIVETKGRDIIR
jgi:hypothetical protein